MQVGVGRWDRMEASEARLCSALSPCAAALVYLCFGAGVTGSGPGQASAQRHAGGGQQMARRVQANAWRACLERAAVAGWCGGAAAGVLFGWQG